MATFAILGIPHSQGNGHFTQFLYRITWQTFDIDLDEGNPAVSFEFNEFDHREKSCHFASLGILAHSSFRYSKGIQKNFLSNYNLQVVNCGFIL